MLSAITRQKPNIELAIAEIAARQHGAVTRAQLLVAGASPDTVDRRVKAGRLRRIHKGVYLVGPIEAPRAREMAAVLACGTGAALSHGSAATLWGIVPGVPASVGSAARISVESAARISVASAARDSVSTARDSVSTARASVSAVHVSVPSERRVQRPGIRVHYVGALSPDEVTTRDAIPVTSVARTLYDLVTCTTQRELERALAEAFALRLTTCAAVASLLARHAGRRGARRLHQLLESTSGPALTRSEAEERFLALIRKAQLSGPEVNAELEGYEVDFLWRAERLVVEIDGRAFHSSDRSFENDRLRDARLAFGGRPGDASDVEPDRAGTRGAPRAADPGVSRAGGALAAIGAHAPPQYRRRHVRSKPLSRDPHLGSFGASVVRDSSISSRNAWRSETL